jgi:hypothetical protein
MSDRFRLIYRSCFPRILLGGLALLSIGTLSRAQTDGPLRVHPENPRYDDGLRRAMGQALTMSRRINLARTTPSKEFINSMSSSAR